MLGIVVSKLDLEGIEVNEKVTGSGEGFDHLLGETELKVAAAHDRISKFVPTALREAADLYESRNAIYGDNYKEFGKVMVALFPKGLEGGYQEERIEYMNRLGVLIQIVSKLSRYCANFDRGGHADSLRDLAVYAIMLEELDADSLTQGREG